MVRYWPPTNSILLLGVCTSVSNLVKIDKEMRPWEWWHTDRHTDTQTHRQTDRQTQTDFIICPIAICYSYGADKKGLKFNWSDSAQQAFDSIKKSLLETPVLAFPYANRPCILDTDASDVAVGAVLSQIVDEQERPILFFSKVMSPTQRNYCAIRRELLAVVASMQHFRHYLLNNCLLYTSDAADE